MATWEKTRSIVRGCNWWEDKELYLCPLYNDCCCICMHPHAPRDKHGERRYFTLNDAGIPEECPLRQRNLTVEMI